MVRVGNLPHTVHVTGPQGYGDGSLPSEVAWARNYLKLQ